MNIRSLKQNATVLDRNQMKSLTGGDWGKDGAICASTVSKVMYNLRHTGNSNDSAQADAIEGMLNDGTLQPDMDC